MSHGRGSEVILASAGSGKTFRLAMHAIGLLVRGVPIDRILASTFTRKAAGEILHRILGRLADAARTPEGMQRLTADLVAVGLQTSLTQDHVRTILAETVERFGSIKIQTLDSFFASIAQAAAMDLEMSPGWRVADDHEDAALRELAAERALDALADNDRLLLLDLLSTREAIGSDVRGPLLDIINECHSAFVLLGRSTDPFGVIGPADDLPSVKDIEGIAKAIQECEAPRSPRTGKPNGHWVKAIDRVASSLSRGDWQDILSHGLVRAAMASPHLYYKIDVPDSLKDLLTRAWHAASSISLARLRSRNLAAAAMTSAFDREYQTLQAESRLIRFDDVPILLGDDIGTSRLQEALFRLDGRIDHVLLDEYQDTSIVQERLLLPIMDELLGHPDRSVFVVGDPKQSLYGWRHAEPALLETLSDRRGLPETTLETSWRCSPAVLDATNEVFESITRCDAFQEDPLSRVAVAWRQRYRTHAAEHKDQPGLARLEIGGETLDERLDRAAEIVSSCLTPDRRATLAVLCRQNKHVQPMIDRLSRLGIEASEEGGGTIADTPATRAALSVLRLAAHPGDTMAAHVACSGPFAALQELSHNAGDVRTTARAQSHRLRRSIADRGCSHLVERMIAEHDASMSARENARMQQLAQLAWEIDQKGLGPAELVAVAVTANRPLDSDAMVRVMTIHKSKGLEFDAVVLPDLDWKLSPRGGGVLTRRRGVAEPIDAISLWPASPIRDAHPDLQAMYDEHAQRTASEGLSALYVAMTRAKHRLDMIVAPPPSNAASPSPATLLRHALLVDGSNPKEYRCGDWATSLASPLESAVGRDGAAAPFPTPKLHTPRQSRTGRLQRTTPTSHAERLRVADVIGSDSLVSERGSRWHRWLESVGWLDETFAVQHLAHASEHRGDAQLFMDMLDGPIGDALRLPDVGSGLSVRLEREWSFAVRLEQAGSGSSLATGRIDRLTLIEDVDGRVQRAVVDDLKTDAIGTDSLDDAIERHKPQLELYRHAVAAAFGMELGVVATRLLFAHLGMVIEVDSA